MPCKHSPKLIKYGSPTQHRLDSIYRHRSYSEGVTEINARLDKAQKAGSIGRISRASLCVFALFSLMAHAQPEAPGVERFHHVSWTYADGLGAVFNVQQSPDGFLWLTTARGVLRFDGLRFESLQQVTFGAVQDSDVLSVFIASSGSAWLTTRSAGTLRWRAGVLTASSDRRCTPAGLGGGMIVEESDDSLWFASTTGLTHLQGSVCEVVGPEKGYPGRLPKALFVDRERTVWVVSPSNDLLFKPHGERAFRLYNTTIHSSGTSVAIRQGALGGIWIADDSGIRRLGTITQANFPKVAENKSPSSRDFVFAADGSLWTVADDGVSHYSREAVSDASPYLAKAPLESFTTQEGLTSDGVSKLMLDHEGNLWIGTTAGLDTLHRSLLQALNLPHAQEHQIGLAAGGKGDIWIGSRSMPLTHVSPGDVIKSFPEIDQLTCIRRDHNGIIWIGGRGKSSLWRFDGDKFINIPGPHGDDEPVVALEVDRNNAPWIYTINGLSYRLLNGSWVNVNQELGKKPAVLGSMTSDETGNIWFAFSDKLVKWDGSMFERHSYPQTNAEYLPCNHVGAKWSCLVSWERRGGSLLRWPFPPDALEGAGSYWTSLGHC